MRYAWAAGGVVLVVALGAAAVPPAREAVVQTFEPAPARADILFAGDMMFDRSLRQYAERYGDDYLLECMSGTLAGADLVVANLEGPITDEPSVSVGTVPGSSNNYIFTFPTSTAALLMRHGIELVSLGNNHIENFGTAGVVLTNRYLAAAGVRYFGDPLDHAVAEVKVQGIAFSFIAYNEFLPPGEGTEATTLRQIAEAKAKGRVPVVYAHWGIEYKKTAAPYMVALAHRFVDAGAAAVIGSHPHVVQNSEVYQGAPIYYSLGNFVFDQYFTPEVTQGLLIEISFSADAPPAVTELPVTLTPDRRVCPAS